jgi:phosphate:Na+ symporter
MYLLEDPLKIFPAVSVPSAAHYQNKAENATEYNSDRYSKQPDGFTAVLAFVGAGVFTMRKCHGHHFRGGGNGDHLDSWLVATLGFNVDIEWSLIPQYVMGGSYPIWQPKTTKYIGVSFFLFLLAFGLYYLSDFLMKTAMQLRCQIFRFFSIYQMAPAVFLLIGFVTLTVQSSSVTMASNPVRLHIGAVSSFRSRCHYSGISTGTTIKISC